MNSLFAGGQFALVAVDRYRVEQAAGGGARRARSVMRALKSLSFQLSGAQLGITASSLVLGFVVDASLGPLIRPAVAWIPGVNEGSLVPITAGVALGVATATQMVLGELAPKNLAIARPMWSATLFVPPMLVFSEVLRPVIQALNAAANWVLLRVGIQPREELEGMRSVEELRGALRWAQQEGALHGVEHELLDRVLRLGEQTAREVLVPRSAVVALHADDSLADLARASRDSGFSRFPVYATGGDDVIGVAHVKDTFGIDPETRAATQVVAHMQPAFVVPLTRDLRSLLVDLRTERHWLAVAVDEHGSAAGIVTAEDVIEELLGPIEDEYDAPGARQIVQAGPGAHIVVGDIRRDELQEAIGFTIPEGRFETLAGLLLTMFQRLPTPGDQTTYGGWTFRVLEMDGVRIGRVLMTAPTTRRDAE